MYAEGSRSPQGCTMQTSGQDVTFPKPLMKASFWVAGHLYMKSGGKGRHVVFCETYIWNERRHVGAGVMHSAVQLCEAVSQSCALNPVHYTMPEDTSLAVEGAACSVVVKLMDLDPQGRGFNPMCGHGKICTAVGPLSKALNPTLLQEDVSRLV